MRPLLLILHDHFEYRGGGETMLLRVARLAREFADPRLGIIWGQDAGILQPDELGMFDETRLFRLPDAVTLSTACAQYRGLREMSRWMEELSPAAVLSFTVRSSVRAAGIVRRLGLPFGWMCQQSFPLFLPPRQRVKQFLGSRALLRARTRIVCISNESVAAFRGMGFPSDHLCLIRNGIDCERVVPESASHDEIMLRRAELGIGDAELAGVCVARLDPIKNHGVILRGLSELNQRGRRVAMLFVGGTAPHAPEYTEKLHAQCRELGLERQVVFAGDQTDVHPWLAISDFAVLASRKEAGPLALAEAGAAGLPLIGSQVGGIPDIVVPDVTGFLFRSDDEKSFADALFPLLKDSVLRRRLGMGARQLVCEEFNMARQTERWRDFLHHLLRMQVPAN